MATQIAHLRELGYRTVFAAIPSHYDAGFDDASWQDFRAHAHELGADQVIECRFDDLGLIRRSAETLKALAMRMNAMHWALAPAQFTTVNAELSEALNAHETPLIVANHVYTMPFAHKIKQRMISKGKRPVLVTCTHDVQSHILLDRQAKAPWKRTIEHEALLLDTETEWLQASDALIHVSEDDLKLFGSHLRHMSHYLMLPAVASMAGPPDTARTRELIYVGAPHPGNVASIKWYIEQVVPHYDKVIPHLTLVGRINEARKEYMSGRSPHWLEAVGSVEFLRPYYASARLAICPTIQGRGISVKTIEAIAAGLPVVGTKLAFRGMPKKDMAAAGINSFDDPAAFAAEVTRLLAQQSLADESKSSLALYEKLFTPKHSLEIFTGILRDHGLPTA